MYLASLCKHSSSAAIRSFANTTVTALGVVLVYQASRPSLSPLAEKIGIPYFSISVSLNVLLTLMIVVHLILHDREIRNAMGAPAKASRLYKTIITILIESCALYAVTSLLFVGPWAAKNRASDIFLPALAEVQVCASVSPDVSGATDHLIMVINRSLRRSLSLYGSLTGSRLRTMAPPGTPDRLLSGAKEGR